MLYSQELKDKIQYNNYRIVDVLHYKWYNIKQDISIYAENKFLRGNIEEIFSESFVQRIIGKNDDLESIIQEGVK